MNCHEIQNLLAAYYDGELGDESAAAVADHLARCEVCAGELAGFAQLSQATEKLEQPQAPAEIWDALSAQLDERRVIPPARSNGRLLRTRPMLALAASLLVTAFAVAGVWLWNTSTQHDHLATNFDTFLDQFPENPEQAQQVLLVNYNGKRSTREQASRTLGYTPVAAAHVPDGYAIEDVYLLDMPCCKCSQIIYRTPDGRRVAVFEHDTEQPMWFGNRPAITCQCNGRPTDLVEVNNRQLAATQKVGGRYVTLIGCESLDEVNDLMRALSQSAHST